MAVEDDDWEGIVSSLVSHSQSRESNRKEDPLSLEDAAWIDSCLVKDPEISTGSWDSLKDTLLEILNYHTKHESSAGEINKIPEEHSEYVPASEEAETTQFRHCFIDDVPPSSLELEENGDNDLAEVAEGFLDFAESTESIFRVWDLDVPLEEGELGKQLKKALAESSFRVSPAVYDGSAAPYEQSLDDIIASMSDLSLQPHID